MTTLGPIVVYEQLWRRGSKCERPLRTHAQLQHRSCSLRLQRALTDFGADHAFATAADKVQEHYGVRVPVERVRIVTLHHGNVLTARAPTPVRALPAVGAERIVAEADGTMIPIVDTSAAPAGTDRRKHRKVFYKEARLAAAQKHRTVTTHYAATLHDVADTGLRWAQCTQAAGWGLNTQIHALGDGAPWIADQARIHFGTQGRYTIDLYHVCEYLAAAAPDPAHTKAFVAPLREALRASDTAPVLAALRPRAERQDIPDEKAPVRSALRYLENRPEQLDYAHALALELPVGSGLIESGHKHVLQARLKKSGTWWTAPNAHALCQLRTLRANHLWGKYWSSN